MGRDRGQTTLDFAIGISIFLAVLLFVFSFVPGLLQPFVQSGEENTALSGRLADRLAQDTLGEPAQPYVLDSRCTVGFFDNTALSGCQYSTGPLEERLELGTFTNVNITLSGNVTRSVSGTNPLCWDDSPSALTERGSGTCDVDLSEGAPTPQSSDTTVTARRVVSLAGEEVTMRVIVW